ncbi:hypothetical protein ANN_18147 [Periplaneta americana]|uniref:Uncharacterized protein n=1 Tax=Periplaneta americana TaxID=6978 RepID=A0ABQ8SP74_PERAM|nr:hypothetical protein ANN_18147 [Periplaneta americana]
MAGLCEDGNEPPGSLKATVVKVIHVLSSGAPIPLRHTNKSPSSSHSGYSVDQPPMVHPGNDSVVLIMNADDKTDRGIRTQCLKTSSLNMLLLFLLVFPRFGDSHLSSSFSAGLLEAVIDYLQPSSVYILFSSLMIEGIQISPESAAYRLSWRHCATDRTVVMTSRQLTAEQFRLLAVLLTASVGTNNERERMRLLTHFR